MRITDTGANRSFLLEVARQREALGRASSEISTGRKLQRPSDDPLAAEQSILIRADLSRNEQYKANGTLAQSRLEIADSVINSLQLALNKGLELTTQGLSGTTTPTTRAILAEQIDGLIKQSFSLGNTIVQGEYIFAGTATTAPPFADTAGTITYAGNSEAALSRISDNTLVQTNVTGAELFTGAVDLFATLETIKQALTADDTTALQQGLTDLRAALNHTDVVRGQVGATMNHVETRMNQIEVENLSLTANKAAAEDADLVAAITRLNQAQTVLQASVGAQARVLKLSLLDYLQ